MYHPSSQLSLLILYNQYHSLHKLCSKPHPQQPQRIESIIQYLKQLQQYKNKIFEYRQLIDQDNKNHQKQENSQRMTDEQLQKITIKQIVKLHGSRYFDFVEGMWCQGISRQQMFINQDTYYMKHTFRAALQAAKTSIFMVHKYLSQSKRTNLSQSKRTNIFSLIRPPGHHSGLKQQPHGFSFFNNIALAADYFTSKTKKKCVILDWDIHHGEGTQKIFYQRNDVFYISIHRYDNGKFFPHIKQSASEYVGQKQGKGYNLNICWNFPIKKNNNRQDNQTVRDQEYLYCLQNVILKILKQYQYQAIFISCGFDAASGDPIGDSKITPQGYKIMTNMLAKLNKQIFIILEGGYNQQCLKKSTQAVLEGLNLKLQLQTPQIKFQQLNKFAQNDIENSLTQISKYWKLN